MKTLFIIAGFALAVFAVPIKEEERISGENGWYVPNSDGSLDWVDKEEGELLLAEGISEKGFLSKNKVKFFLLTNSHPDEQQEITDTTKSIKSSRFNASNPTRFTIHGWNGSGKDDWHFSIANSWFSRGEFNMIQVEWSRAKSLEYASSVTAVPTVGKKVANMINFLESNFGLSLSNLQVIGHSLGAHVAGYAGKNVNGQIHTIVGLDPALPLYSYEKTDERLDSSDAFYVESIHTNGGKLGFLKPIGRAAFYPNGGKKQPGCGLDLVGSCSHSRSHQYYAASILYDNFPSVSCPDYEEAVKKDCGATYSSTNMGAESNAYLNGGQFYVPVSSTYPYGLGTDE